MKKQESEFSGRNGTHWIDVCTLSMSYFHFPFVHTHNEFIYCFELVLAANAGIFTVDGDAHVQCAMCNARSEKERAVPLAVRTDGMRNIKGSIFKWFLKISEIYFFRMKNSIHVAHMPLCVCHSNSFDKNGEKERGKMKTIMTIMCSEWIQCDSLLIKITAIFLKGQWSLLHIRWMAFLASTACMRCVCVCVELTKAHLLCMRLSFNNKFSI